MKRWISAPLVGAFLFVTAAAAPAKAFIVPIPLIAAIGAVLGIGVGAEVYEHERRKSEAVPLCTTADCHLVDQPSAGPRPANAPKLVVKKPIKKHFWQKAPPAPAPVVVETPAPPPVVVVEQPAPPPQPRVVLPAPPIEKPAPKVERTSWLAEVGAWLVKIIIMGVAAGVIIGGLRFVYGTYRSSKGVAK